MNKTEETKNYLPPQLTVVEFKSERGYASSTLFEEFNLWRSSSQSSDQMETYSTGNGWNEGSNHFWD